MKTSGPAERQPRFFGSQLTWPICNPYVSRPSPTGGEANRRVGGAKTSRTDRCVDTINKGYAYVPGYVEFSERGIAGC